MSNVALGTVPDDLTVTLTPGADFNATIRNIEPDSITSENPQGTPLDWEAGTTVRLELGPPNDVFDTWEAAVTGSEAVFSVDKAVVKTVIDARITHARLYGINGDVEIPWATGEVVVR